MAQALGMVETVGLTGVIVSADAMSKAVEAYPDDLTLHVIYGTTLITLERNELAVEVFSHALELDPSLGTAHASIGTVKLMFDWDWYGPDADYRRALELNPNDADIRFAYDFYLTIVRRHDEAIEHARKAVELDPLTPQRALHLGWVFHYAGRYDESIEVLQKLLGDEIRVSARRNLAKSKSFKKLLEETLIRYHKRSIDAAKVIKLMLEIKNKMEDDLRRAKLLRLSDEELAFYDAVQQA